MLRGFAYLLVIVLITPPFAVAAILWHLLWPRAEAIPVVGRVWARILMQVAGVRLTVRSGEIPAASRPAVIVGNHASDFDVYCAALALPDPIRFVAKESLFRIPFFGQAIRAAGFIPLERSGEQTDIDRLRALHVHLAAGAYVIFFPEGTRSRTGRLGRFKKGAFVMAIQTRVPVIPMVIRGAHRVQPARSWRILPGTVDLEFLEPVPTEGLELSDRNALIERVYARILDELPEEQQPDAGDPAHGAVPPR